MAIFSTKNKILAILGSLIVGAFGSGLWDIAVKPSGLIVGRLILTLVSLGSHHVKDSIYVEAARGPHEAAGVVVLVVITAFLLVLPLLMIAWTLRLRIQFAKISAPQNDSMDLSQSAFDRKIARTRKLFIAQYIILGILLIQTGAGFIGNLKVLQANSALAYFAQSMTICRPYMDDHQYEMLESRFARIQGRNDYLVITSELQKFADSKQLELPKYSPW